MHKIPLWECLPCSELDTDLKSEAISAMRKRHPHIFPGAIENCFERYPRVVVVKRFGKVAGLFFVNEFSKDKDTYLYVGPLIFIDRISFASATLTLFFSKLLRFRRLYILAEIQNPELLIHVHSVMKTAIYPRPFSFDWDDQINTVRSEFMDKIPQLGEVNRTSFTSRCSENYFRKTAKRNALHSWLIKHGVNLEKSESLIVIMVLNKANCILMILRTLFFITIYPKHREWYLKKLERVLESEE